MMELLWGTLLVAFAVLLSSKNVDVVSGEASYNPSPPPYSYKWPMPSSPPPPLHYEQYSPPPPSNYISPPPHQDLHPIVIVAGKVYCYQCYNWKHPATSHQKKLSKGALVKVTCTANGNHYVGYGKTTDNGKYIATIKGYSYWNNGAEGCKAQLQAAPKGSMCNIPTNLHQGVAPKLYSKTNKEVLLKAKSLAFAHDIPYEKCEEHNHHKKAPPLQSPSLGYYYKSPPPPSPSPPLDYHHSSPPPPSPSPPPYYYTFRPSTYLDSSPPPPFLY